MTVSCLIYHLPIVHFNAIICIADFAFILFLKFSQKLKIYYIRYPLKITPLLSSHTSWNVAPRSMMRLSLYHRARRVLNL